MDFKKRCLFVILALALQSCSNTSQVAKPSDKPQPNQPTDEPELTSCANPNPNLRSVLWAKFARTKTDTDAEIYAELVKNQNIQVKTIWGKDGFVEPDKHRYIKYLDSFKTRADIHFDTGKIYISTINRKDPLEKLREAIVQMILLPPDPKSIDIFGPKEVYFSGTPFFLGQILDQNNEPMDTEEKAERFADYLIANKLKDKRFIIGAAKYVEIDLVKDHEQIREYKFSKQVKEASKRYGVPEDLIYAVIKTESSFNPYAVSHAGAIGLMQVVPTTAGADVFKLIKNKEGIPTKEYLFDPSNNIDAGVAYLSILHNRYLKSVKHKISKHFAVISAYNGGTGNVLNTFDNDNTTAVERINNTLPRQVYCILTTYHPREESRNYLNKVLKAQRSFNINDI